MSRRRPPWSSLGIDPTGDEREIKRAYAKKLKAIDVEAEPAKFIALRQQFDNAMGQARWIGREDEPDDYYDYDDEEELEVGEEGLAGGSVPEIADAALSVAVPPLPDRANPWAVPEVDRVEAHFAAIAAALRTPGAGSEAAIDRAARALWAEPALETVDGAEDAEQRLAHLVLNHGVDAAYLLRLASWHYGWVRRAQRVGTDWPISEVGRRAAAENWFQRIIDNKEFGHPEVIAELGQMPTGVWWRDLARKRRIREFLTVMRRRFPEGEYRFDPDIVGAWEEARDFRFPWQALILGFVVALGMASRTRPPPLLDPLFWAWWVGAAGGLFALTALLRRRAATDRRRMPERIDRREAIAFAGLLGVLPIAILAPATLPITLLLMAAAILLFFATGAAPPAGANRGFWARVVALRYPMIAAILFVQHAIGQAAAGNMDWRQAVVPGLLALLAAHWLRARLVNSWEMAPRRLLIAVRAALLVPAAGLLWLSVQLLPQPPVEAAVIGAILILLVQDSAADAHRTPLSTSFLIAYVLLVSGLVMMPLTIAMALVVRRIADRLFIKA